MAKSLFSVYAAVAGNGVLGLLAVPIGLRYLGIEGYGLFSLYTLMVSYILMTDLGVSKNLFALLSRHREPENQLEYMRTAFGLYCCLCMGWLLLMPLLLWLVPAVVFPVIPAHRSALRWLTVLAIGEFALGVPQSLMQTSCLAKEQFTGYSRYTLLSGVLRNAILIAGSIVFRSPQGLALAMFARKSIDVYLAYRLMGAVPREVWQPRFSIRPAVAMLRQSGTLSVAQVLYSSLMGAGSYLVNAFFGLHWLGLYRAAFDLAGKVSVIANGIALVLFPKLAYAFTNPIRRKAMGTILRPALEISWTFYSVLGSIAVIAAPWVLPRIGVPQPEALTLFVLLVIGLSLNCHTLVTNEIIQASGNYRQNILVSLSGLLLIASVFWVSTGRIGVAAIGVAWIVAAAGSGLVADGVVSHSLEIPSRTRIVSGTKKALITILCVSTLGPYFGFAPRQLSWWALSLLIILLIRECMALSRKRNGFDWIEVSAPSTEQQAAAA